MFPWKILFGTLAILSFTAHADVPKTTIKIAATNYSTFIKANGIHRQVVEQAFEHLPQYQLQWHHNMSLSRSLTELAAGRVNGIVNVATVDQPNGCLTDPAFKFFNVFVVYRPSGVVLNHLNELKHKTVNSFIRANKLMGIRYANAVAGNVNYREMQVQKNQVQSIVKGLSEVSVGDINIFIDSLNQYNRRIPENRRVKISDFDYYWSNNIVHTKIAFDNPVLCREFNVALKKLDIYQEAPSIIAQHNIELIEL